MKKGQPVSGKTPDAGIWRTLFAVFMLPAFLLLAVLVLPLAGFFAACAWIWLRWRLLRHGVRFYIVCSRRRRWRELLLNNLEPVLPRSVETCWVHEDYPLWRAHAMTLVRRVGIHLPRPYLVEVQPFGLRLQGLHEAMLPLKQFGGRDPQVQRQVREVLRAAIGDQAPAVTERGAF